MPPQCCGEKTPLYVLTGLGLLGAVGSGLYTTYMFLWEYENIRWSIIHLYLTFFSVAIVSAELGLLNHPAFKKFGMFLTTFTGRAFFYIFIGGLVLDGWGWACGIYMIALGLLNLFAQCAWSDALSAKTSATASI